MSAAKGKRFYLSGPMTGYAEWNFPAFTAAAKSLRAKGLDVLPAHEIPHDEPDGVVGALPWAVYLRDDLRELLNCDALILLRGWPTSSGARLELQTALALGMPVFFWDGRTVVDMNAEPRDAEQVA